MQNVRGRQDAPDARMGLWSGDALMIKEFLLGPANRKL
jgi:hypothetical protein